jgi:hypothetical protein
MFCVCGMVYSGLLAPAVGLGSDVRCVVVPGRGPGFVYLVHLMLFTSRSVRALRDKSSRPDAERSRNWIALGESDSRTEVIERRREVSAIDNGRLQHLRPLVIADGTASFPASRTRMAIEEGWMLLKPFPQTKLRLRKIVCLTEPPQDEVRRRGSEFIILALFGFIIRGFIIYSAVQNVPLRAAQNVPSGLFRMSHPFVHGVEPVFGVYSYPFGAGLERCRQG